MNRDKTTLLEESRNRWKAKAQLMEKVSWGLTLAVVMLAILLAVITAALDKSLARVENTTTTEVTTSQSQTTTTKPAETTVEPPIMEYIGDYLITYYCSCEKCSWHWKDKTSSGATAQEGITIAVDPKKIPYGTKVYIEGVGYRIAQDCGGAIKGNRIDVYMNSHQEALEHGIHEAKVYIMTTGGNNNG